MPPVQADELSSFEQAREAYEAGRYAEAAQQFEALLDQPLHVGSVPLRLESHKYLGASYLFLGQSAAAAAQFEQLLEEDPRYEIDPLAFPEEVIAAFEAVRSRREDEVRRAREARAEQERRARQVQAERLLREQQQLQALLDLAQTERIEREHSRWIALLPFGVGQFQNGHDGLGLTLAISEGLLLAAHVGTYIAHRDLEGVRPVEDELNRARVIETTLRLGNQISLGLFALVAAIGILDAQLRFKPKTVVKRSRPLPPELQGLDLERPSQGGLELSAGGVGWRF